MKDHPVKLNETIPGMSGISVAINQLIFLGRRKLINDNAKIEDSNCMRSLFAVFKIYSYFGNFSKILNVYMNFSTNLWTLLLKILSED